MKVFKTNKTKQIQRFGGLYQPPKYWGSIVVLKRSTNQNKNYQMISPDGRNCHFLNHSMYELLTKEINLEQVDESNICPTCGRCTDCGQ